LGGTPPDAQRIGMESGGRLFKKWPLWWRAFRLDGLDGTMENWLLIVQKSAFMEVGFSC
jgi:hypothetical protein